MRYYLIVRQILLLTLIFFGISIAVRLSQTPPGQRPISFLPVKIPESGVLTNLGSESEGIETAELLLPDLQVLPPREIYLTAQGGKQLLRYSTTFYNTGQGPLEVLGHTDAQTEKTYAAQYVKQAGGPGIFRDIGMFVLHPTHEHWHVEGWAQYQLWSVKENGDRGELLITTDKHSFCIWDEDDYDLKMTAASQSRQYFYTCNRQVQGMSVGWSDTYRARVDGQEMDLGNLGDGQYIFRSIINPDKKFMEGSYDNNTNEIYLEINNGQLRTRDSF